MSSSVSSPRVKAGYHALDKNWEGHHEACMGAIRQALDMPDATVPELAAEIRRLKAALTRS